MSLTMEEAVAQAQAGSKTALEYVVEQIQDMIYGLALRMLWHPEDARDATQEILIRVITHLGGFRGESAFKTWVYRVASNYLLTARKSRLEEQAYTFEQFGKELDDGLSDELKYTDSSPEHSLLLEEVKIGCTLGMLLCLDRPHRLAYILGEILEIDSREAAGILEITPAAFRKRLSRARSDIFEFTRRKCGLANPENACRCHRRVDQAIKSQRVNPKRRLFADDINHATRFPDVLREIRKLDEIRRAAAVYRSHPQYKAPENLAAVIRTLIDSEIS